MPVNISHGKCISLTFEWNKVRSTTISSILYGVPGRTTNTESQEVNASVHVCMKYTHVKCTMKWSEVIERDRYEINSHFTFTHSQSLLITYLFLNFFFEKKLISWTFKQILNRFIYERFEIHLACTETFAANIQRNRCRSIRADGNKSKTKTQNTHIYTFTQFNSKIRVAPHRNG